MVKFVGGAWEAGTRAGNFRRFFEAHAGLDRATLLAQVPWPHLLVGWEPDPRTWDQAVVLRLAPHRAESHETVLGRDLASDVVLNCPSVSNRHAVLSRSAGKWCLADEGSKTGTTIGETALEPHRPTPVEGDRAVVAFGPDVRGLFLVPESLPALFDEARALLASPPPPKPPAPPRPGRPVWPTYSLLQDPSPTRTATELELKPYQPQPVGAAPIRVDRPVARPAEARGARSLYATPRRIALTAGAVVVVAIAAKVLWRPIGLELFGRAHPEWFYGK